MCTLIDLTDWSGLKTRLSLSLSSSLFIFVQFFSLFVNFGERKFYGMNRSGGEDWLL